jgi:hypothetical protein
MRRAAWSMLCLRYLLLVSSAWHTVYPTARGGLALAGNRCPHPLTLLQLHGAPPALLPTVLPAAAARGSAPCAVVGEVSGAAAGWVQAPAATAWELAVTA